MTIIPLLMPLIFEVVIHFLFMEINKVNDMNIFYFFHQDVKLVHLANQIKLQVILIHLGIYIVLNHKMFLNGFGGDKG